MKFSISALLCALLFPSIAMAAPHSFLSEIAGVYKDKFKNESISGDTYQSENILEIVPVDGHAAYIRMKLEFYNGHQGDISGVAVQQENNTLVYNNTKENCELKLVWDKNNVISHVDYEKFPGCSYFHGARGTLNNMKFPIKSKRTIRYLKIIHNSEQFKQAMKEYQDKT